MLCLVSQCRLFYRNRPFTNKLYLQQWSALTRGIYRYSQVAIKDSSLPLFELTDDRLANEALLTDPCSQIPESLDELSNKAMAPYSRTNPRGDGWTEKDCAFLKMRFFDHISAKYMVPNKYIPKKENDKLYRKLSAGISEPSQRDLYDYRNVSKETFEVRSGIFKETFLWVSRCRGLYVIGERRDAQRNGQPTRADEELNPIAISKLVLTSFLKALLPEIQSESSLGEPRLELRYGKIPITWHMGNRKFEALVEDALYVGEMHPSNIIMPLVVDFKTPHPVGTKHTPQNPPRPYVSSQVRSRLCALLLAQAASRKEVKTSRDQTAFVAHFQGTSLTIVAAEFSANYLDTLKKTGTAVEEIIVRRSEVFNFRHKKDRTRAVRIFIALLRWFIKGNPKIAPLQATKASAMAEKLVTEKDENVDTLAVGSSSTLIDEERLGSMR